MAVPGRRRYFVEEYVRATYREEVRNVWVGSPALGEEEDEKSTPDFELEFEFEFRSRKTSAQERRPRWRFLFFDVDFDCFPIDDDEPGHEALKSVWR